VHQARDPVGLLELLRVMFNFNSEKYRGVSDRHHQPDIVSQTQYISESEYLEVPEQLDVLKSAGGDLWVHGAGRAGQGRGVEPLLGQHHRAGHRS
jgi:hypothetical protein